MSAVSSISINENRVAVSLTDGKTAQFVVWDLEEKKHTDLEMQIKTAFDTSSNFEEIETHLRLNGFDASLEDIY